VSSRASNEDRSRADPVARLLESIPVGVFVGILGFEADDDATSTVNPSLRSIFGYGDDVPEDRIAPFAPERFAEPSARVTFLTRLKSECTLTDHLLRMRRMDGSPVWVEVTAHAEVHGPAVRVDALVRDVSRRKKLDDQSRDVYQWRRSGRRSRE
jgi:PAS domain S-box-containing protein